VASVPISAPSESRLGPAPRADLGRKQAGPGPSDDRLHDDCLGAESVHEALPVGLGHRRRHPRLRDRSPAVPRLRGSAALPEAAYLAHGPRLLGGVPILHRPKRRTARRWPPGGVLPAASP